MKTILLADDSITIQKVVELTFSEADYRVICVSTGGQALKRIPEVRPDVVLLDVIMPEKNGYEVCEQLKRNPATSGIPVLLLTGTFEPFDRKRAEAAGASGHLTKPFESQALISKVEDLIAATPSVATDTEGGRMDIISGGEVYRVDPAKAAEGMRPAPAAPAAFTPSEPQPAAHPVTAAPPAFPPSVAAPSSLHETERGGRLHPALAPPDPAAGGSFIGFADVRLDGDPESGIVPDRFDSDSRTAPGSSVAPRREESGSSPAPFAGSFESEFDLVDDAPATAPAASPEGSLAETGGWEPPAEAPPAETWQTLDEPVSPMAPTQRTMPPMTASHAAAPMPAFQAQAEPGGRSPGLTPEMIDLIAEKVVERLSDRVVREVAWEVIPGVAEALVRKRIKELEDSGS